MSSLSDCIVHSATGIDHEASMAKFSSLLKSKEAEIEMETSTIAAAVNSVFDKYPGQPLAQSKIVHYALTELNVQPETFSTLEKKVLAYIRANYKGDSSFLVSVKGPDGGTCRRSDLGSK